MLPIVSIINLSSDYVLVGVALKAMGCPLQVLYSTPYLMSKPPATLNGSHVSSCFGQRYFTVFLNSHYLFSRKQHFFSSFQEAKQPGAVTRLLSAVAPDHLMASVPTHISPAWDMVCHRILRLLHLRTDARICTVQNTFAYSFPYSRTMLVSIFIEILNLARRVRTRTCLITNL